MNDMPNVMLSPKPDPLVETPTGFYERAHVINRLDRLMTKFQEKSNSRGINVLLEIYPDARYGDYLNPRKWNWIQNNVAMHSLPRLNPWSLGPIPVPDPEPDVPEVNPLIEAANTSEITALINDIYTLLGGVADKLEELRKFSTK